MTTESVVSIWHSPDGDDIVHCETCGWWCDYSNHDRAREVAYAHRCAITEETE